MLRVLVLSRKLSELIPIEAVCSKTQCPTPRGKSDTESQDSASPDYNLGTIRTLCVQQFCSWEPLVRNKSSVWTKDRVVELSARPAMRTQHSI